MPKGNKFRINLIITRINPIIRVPLIIIIIIIEIMIIRKVICNGKNNSNSNSSINKKDLRDNNKLQNIKIVILGSMNFKVLNKIAKQTIKKNTRTVTIITITIKWIEVNRTVEMTTKNLINSIQKIRDLEADHNPKINNKITHIINKMWDLDTVIINKILNIRKNRAISRKRNQMLTLTNS